MTEKNIEDDMSSQDSLNRRRMKSENLVSVVLVSSNRTDVDTTEIRALSNWCASRFDYYEIIIVAGHALPGWRTAIKPLGSEVSKMRVIRLHSREDFDAVALAALDQAIGDYVLVYFPNEITFDCLDRVAEVLAAGQADLVRVRFAAEDRGYLEAAGTRVAQLLLRFATGKDFQAFPARAIGLSRAAITRIGQVGGYMRFFRLLDLSDHFDEQTLVAKGGERRVWSDLQGKLRVTGEVFSTSAIRMVRLLSVFCFVLALFSFGAGVLSFFIWIFMSDIAPGWTSLSMLLSILFGSNFAVLGAICLGLVRIIHQATPDIDGLRADEISGGDLFESGTLLNVKGNND